jgi:hypothetical protein
VVNLRKASELREFPRMNAACPVPPRHTFLTLRLIVPARIYAAKFPRKPRLSVEIIFHIIPIPVNPQSYRLNAGSARPCFPRPGRRPLNVEEVLRRWTGGGRINALGLRRFASLGLCGQARRFFAIEMSLDTLASG